MLMDRSSRKISDGSICKPVDGVAEHIENSPNDRFADRHLKRSTGIGYHLAPCQAPYG